MTITHRISDTGQSICDPKLPEITLVIIYEMCILVQKNILHVQDICTAAMIELVKLSI